jgi:hypothetical protein
MFKTPLAAAAFYIMSLVNPFISDKCTSHFCYTTVYHNANTCNVDCYFRTEKSMQQTYIQLLHYFHLFLRNCSLGN